MRMSAENQPLVSIVIPVRNGAGTLDACLWSIRRSSYKHVEVIVVDDHSTDDTISVARRHGVEVIGAGIGTGANHARNAGARRAQGEIIAFLDADVVVGRETLLTVVETLEEGGVDAVVGVYTSKHRHEHLISQYKNLWVRYSYIKSQPGIDWLFGAISGIRRDAFERLGGFNIALVNEQGTEDIELGKRFSQASMKVILNTDVEVEHLKNYTIRSFIRNEFTRSMGFAELATRLGETAKSLNRGFANIYASFVISTLFSAVLLAAASAWAAGWIPGWWCAAALGVYFLLNVRFLNYLEQVRGLFAMMVMAPFLLLDHLVCCAGSVIGILKGLFRKSG